jgi:LmbE family N-acetylglucosaminyl deacetylase
MITSLYFAPHPDDDILGAGAHLATAHARGDQVTIVVVTDGGAGGDPAVRRVETAAAAAALGMPESAWMHWDYPDGAVPLTGELIERIRTQVVETRPHRVYLPSPTEQHPDHRRVTRAVLLALTERWRGELWFYETVSPMPVVNCLQPADTAWEQKQAALACHASQLAQFDYPALTEAMGALRGMAAGQARAEGFLAFDWDGSPQNFFETTPLLSVVVRASQPEYLVHALAALATQEYDMIEVVLVWFGAHPPPLDGASMLQISVVAGTNNRATNLNLGVQAAHGEFVAILDEDDIVDPEHYANLLGELRADARVDVAYTGTRLCRCQVVDGRVTVDLPIQQFIEPVSPMRLLVGNVLPIHAFACRTALLRGYPFDASLDAYEDWDMLLRMAFDGRQFRQVEGVTAEYRLFGEEGDLVERHRARGYERWAPVVQGRYVSRLQATHLASWHDSLQQLQRERDESQAALQRTRSQLAVLKTQVATAEDRASLLGRVQRCLGLPLSSASNVISTTAPILAQVGPAICIVLPVYNTAPELLEEAVQSVLDQAYPNWTLRIVDDGSTRDDTRATLARMAEAFAADARIRVHWMAQNQGIVAATNVAASLDKSPWIAFVDHDDRLDPEALFHIALALCENPQARLAYTDNRLIDRGGALLNTYRKPDWSPVLLLSCNYVNHLAVIDRHLFEEIGGLHDDFEGAQDYGLMLECVRRLTRDEVVHIALPLYDWRTTETSVAYEPEQKPHSAAASLTAIEQHLAQIGMQEPRTGWEVGYPGIHSYWEARARAVHFVIVSRSNESGLAAILRTLVACSWSNWRVTVVLNRAPEGYAAQLQGTYVEHPQICWLPDERPLNWAASVNRAVRAHASDALIVLDDDLLPTAMDWLPRMLRYLDLGDVGVIGVRIHAANGRLRHVGAVMDADAHVTNLTDWGGRHERAVSREVSVVRRGVMLIDAALFHACGGFDERLGAHLADVDFCLHARSRGYSVVLASDAPWQTQAGSKLEEDHRLLEAERAAMQAKWAADSMCERFDSRYDLVHHSTRILHVAGGVA